MQENVGGIDRIARFVAGPFALAVGYRALGGDRGAPLGLATMLAGVLILESAITAVCPLNAALDIDTTS